ncbi:MAG: hypothetical protein JW791_05240 [Nanoarchaeota archaeon]|nr:hypothetical protein [Nanoarchaeota archaeon]
MAAKDNTLMATLSYSLIIAPIVLIKEKKDAFARFHAMQATGALIIFLIIRALLGVFFLFGFILPVNGLIAVILAYYAVEAMMGKKTKLPVAYEFGKGLTDLFKQ